MKKLIGIILAAFLLSSCARGCQSMERTFLDNTAHEVRITLYSGGQAVKTWELKGIINGSEQSDGYFFYYEGKLVEVSGDVVIEYLD